MHIERGLIYRNTSIRQWRTIFPLNNPDTPGFLHHQSCNRFLSHHVVQVNNTET